MRSIKPLLVLGVFVFLSRPASSADGPTNEEILKRLEVLELEVKSLKQELSKSKESPKAPSPEEIQKAIDDNIKKFNMLSKSGPSGQSCLMAKGIANLFLQLLRDKEFQEWKLKAKGECGKAGYPDF